MAQNVHSCSEFSSEEGQKYALQVRGIEGSFTKDDDRFEALDSTESITIHPVPHPHPPKIKNSGQHWGQSAARRESFLVFRGPEENVIRVIS